MLTHTYQNHVSDDIPHRNVYVKWRQSPERNWLHGKLSNWQLLVQSVMKILSKWQLFFQSPYRIQFIPINMHTVFALLCFVVVIHWLIFPYPSGLLHWHCGNLTIAPVPATQSWWIWINTWCESITNDCITTTKQSTTKPCAYFLGYTVCFAISSEADIPSHRTLLSFLLVCLWRLCLFHIPCSYILDVTSHE